MDKIFIHEYFVYTLIVLKSCEPATPDTLNVHHCASLSTLQKLCCCFVGQGPFSLGIIMAEATSLNDLRAQYEDFLRGEVRTC